MKITYLTAGAAGMYCGSCMNDNAVARALIRQGHECLLVPVYTPIRTDDDNVSVERVFLGGINVYLQQKLSWMTRVPKIMDAALNQPWLIQWLTQSAGKTSPKLLGALAVSMLEGFRGRQRKEFERLLGWLERDVRPEVIVMTNLLIGGCIPQLKSRLGASVFVTLQGDDIFLDALSERDRMRCEALMQELVGEVDGFLVHSQAYGDAMASRLKIPANKIHVVPLGIATADFRNFHITVDSSSDRSSKLVLGYLARMAPEKGLHRLIDAFIEIKQIDPGLPLRLRLAGWMGPQHAEFWREQQNKLAAARLDGEWEYVGCVDRDGKRHFLESLDLFCVPSVYAEPKGRFLLEAIAMGIPYVVPDHGAFPELHQRIQSQSGAPRGWLFPHDSASELTRSLRSAIESHPKRSAPSDGLLHELDIETHAHRLAACIEAISSSR